MARKPGKKRSPRNTSDYRFAQVAIARSEKQAVEAWVDQNEADFDTLICDLLSNEHTIKLSWSDYSDAYTASITCHDDDNQNGKLILTAQAGSAIDALGLVMYKNYVLCENGAWGVQSDLETWG